MKKKSTKIQVKVLVNFQGEGGWIPLINLSNYLNKRKIIPNLGDTIAMNSDDTATCGVAVAKVKEKWINHPNADIVIILH